MKRIHFVVHGRVQGVGFRYFTRQCGIEFNLTGWVKNLADGSVECEAQGEDSLLDVFYTKLGRGPVLSRVSRIDRNEISLITKENGFEITY